MALFTTYRSIQQFSSKRWWLCLFYLCSSWQLTVFWMAAWGNPGAVDWLIWSVPIDALPIKLSPPHTVLFQTQITTPFITWKNISRSSVETCLLPIISPFHPHQVIVKNTSFHATLNTGYLLKKGKVIGQRLKYNRFP